MFLKPEGFYHKSSVLTILIAHVLINYIERPKILGKTRKISFLKGVKLSYIYALCDFAFFYNEKISNYSCVNLKGNSKTLIF